jgi:hypothetical protein
LISKKYTASDLHPTVLPADELASMNSSLQQCGWLLLQRLVGLDYHWLSSRIKVVFGLWQAAFIDEDKKDPKTTSPEELFSNEFLIDFQIKRLALKSVRVFLEKAQKLHSDNTMRAIASYLHAFHGMMTVFKGYQDKPAIQFLKHQIIESKRVP